MKGCSLLSDLQPGQRATVRQLTTEGGMRRRLMDIGLREGAAVECVGRSPWGDPVAYLICGALIALRREDCAGIWIGPTDGRRSADGDAKRND
ncbi:MAG: ferrous iron transport protein A [Candidatus Fimadaptatus sp.]